MSSNFALCICTFKRVDLLRTLLEDVTKQTLQPRLLIIVDGDPDSCEVLNMLKEQKLRNRWQIEYAPSNHGNQTYQRYLAWRISVKDKLDVLLYLDDDLRIKGKKSLEAILFPFYHANYQAAAVTGNLIMLKHDKIDPKSVTLDDFRESANPNSLLVKIFGESQRYKPGELTPSGKRILVNLDDRYNKIEWLRGGAIAINSKYLSERIFSDDIFAMNHLKLGLCEDLVLARRLMEFGNLYFASRASFIHPSEDSPKAYSSKAYNFGFASSYSRKWLNNNYRGFHSPKFSDRFSLFWSYFSALIIHWTRALIKLKCERVLFAWGYSLGILSTLIRKPTAKNLTPDIDWYKDAEEALKNVVVIQ